MNKVTGQYRVKLKSKIGVRGWNGPLDWQGMVALIKTQGIRQVNILRHDDTGNRHQLDKNEILKLWKAVSN
jgi:hypothetical protein